MDYKVVFPAYLDGYEAETEAKGYLVDVVVSTDFGEIDLVLYDPVRLSQEIEDEMASVGYFVVSNILVVPVVERGTILRVIAKLADVHFHGLVARPR